MSFSDIPRPDRYVDNPEVPDRIGERRKPYDPLAGQQPGQVPQSTLKKHRNGMNGMDVHTTDEEPPDPSGSFKYGTAPNQPSNVPGVPLVSPNGTSNPFGTGGRPVYLDEEPLRR